jgi:hypothetical protein
MEKFSSEQHVDIGNWSWSGGGVTVESKGCFLKEYKHGEYPALSKWVLTHPKGEYMWRSHEETALRRFAHVVITGEYNSLTASTNYGVPKDIDFLWNAYLDHHRRNYA